MVDSGRPGLSGNDVETRWRPGSGNRHGRIERFHAGDVIRVETPDGKAIRKVAVVNKWTDEMNASLGKIFKPSAGRRWLTHKTLLRTYRNSTPGTRTRRQKISR
jgi:hypothetical protein